MHSRVLFLAFILASALPLRAADTTPPAIQVVSPAAGATIGSLTQITVTFSEPVTGITFEDLFINGAASAMGMSGSNDIYTFTLEAQPLYGVVQISWDTNHHILDLAVPPNRFDPAAPGSSWQYNLVDTTPPSVVTVTPVQGVTVRQLTQIDVQFSELVAGVEASDLWINGTPATQLSVLAGGRDRFSFPQPTNGSVQVSWAPNHGIHDFAVPPNAFAGGTWTYTLNPGFGLASVRINEFLASSIGTNGLKDENGELQDWIELHNFGAVTVNLAGYALTDDRNDPGKWTFPATNLAPGQYLVVFASEKDRKAPAAGNRFHASFRLNPFGDYLALFSPDSPRVALTEFAPEYPEQRNDYSYGYDGTNALKYFIAPTPGAANGSSSISGIVPPPHFNVSRGLFNSPFTLILNSSLAGTTIRYTTDGSEPSGTNAIYSGPLQITNTTMLRAAAFKTGMLPSLAATHTYLFPDSVIRQPALPPGNPPNWGTATGSGFPNSTVPADYEMDPEIVTNAAYSASIKTALRSIPTLSIVMNVEDIFGTNNGLYTHSSDSQTLYRGPAWERACSAEFILTNGETGFQVNCGIQIQGNASRNPQKQPKHPFRVLFKGAWGPASLDYQVFPDSPVTSFDSLVLRSDFNSSWTHWDSAQRNRGSRIRDAWSKDTFRAMGGLAGHTRHFHLYINGLYWGLYEFSEKADANYAASYLGGKQAEYDAIASKPTQAIDGDLQAYNAMVAISNLGDINQYNLMLTYLDMPAFIDYMLVEFYGANQDWGLDGNWNAVRRRSPDGRFKYILWDAERLIENNGDNRVSVTTDLPSGLHAKLIASPEYKLAFADRVQKHMFNGGALTTNVMMARWLARAASIDPAIVAESARWGDYRRDGMAIGTQVSAAAPYDLYARNTYWLPEVNRIATNYFPSRHSIFLGQLTAAGLYPGVTAPVFNQQGGSVPRGFGLTMTATNPIYYTANGTDPRVFGTSVVAPVAQTYGAPVSLTNSVVIKARALSGTNWSALTEATFTVDALGSPLRITEIMYNPPGGDAYEYLELQNVSPAALDAGSFSIEGAGYVFPPVTLLAPGQLLVLASDASPVNWSNRYPGITVFGWFSGKLDDGGEKLAIKNAAGQTLWSVDYDDEHGWPAAADGGGASLEIIDVFGDPDDPANWRASANGTPGTLTPPPSPGAVVLNEVMAENVSAVNNGGFHPDWVELRNNGATTTNLVGWSLSDDSNPRKFVFGSNASIAAGGYLVVWCDTNSGAPGLHTQFALGRNGGSVFLYDANTNRVDGLGYGLQLPDYSIGRSPDGTGAWTLTQPTPNAANVAVSLAPSTNLSLNEWLANPAPGADDWVELYNRAASPVALRGIYLGTSNTTFRLTALSFIAAGGYALWRADENPGADHLDFKIGAEGDALALYDEVGAQIERVSFGAQAQGVTQGRLPDGTVTIASFPASASPVASNYLPAYAGPMLNEILAINRASATNAAGRTADFIELRNTNSAAFDLSGMRLGNDPSDPAPWVFPPGVSIAGNGYLVVWFDNELPATTAAGPFQNTGRSLDGESGGVWLLNGAGQPVDSAVFGFQIADLSLGRTTFGGPWTLLASPTPGASNSGAAALGSAAALRLNEWAANSASGGDWFEIYNSGTQPVDLSGLFLSDSPAATALTEHTIEPLCFIGAKGFVRFYADGHPSNGRNHASFSLDGEGEALQIYSAGLGVIDTVYFGAQSASGSQGRLPDGGTNIVSFPLTPTPAESNYLPLPNAVINEVLAHADLPLEDAVEIANPTGTAVNIGGWYLSDSQAEFKKFRIADGTMLPANGFIVIYQSQFNGGPGSLVPFTFDSLRGEEAWLSQADGSGNLSGYRAGAKFGASATGISFGRCQTSVGTDFTAQSQRTLNAVNTLPLVGPVVINELMHHPPDVAGADNSVDEYIELHNITTAAVPLYDPAAATNTWRLRGGVTFNFPEGVTLGARSFLLVVSFDPVSDPGALAYFRSYYGVPAGVPVHGPYSGKLDNGGEAVELLKSDVPDQGFVPYVRADYVTYDDSSPWPFGADGTGSSLQRRRPYQYGNDPLNWKADAPTPGRANVAGSDFTDTDGDGMPDSYEQANGLDRLNPADAAADADGDGHGNYEEFVDGTDPRNASSHLDAPFITAQPQGQVVFLGSNTTFSVTAGGTAPLRYQWRFNGVSIANATNSTFSVINAQAADAGTYSATVLNGAGFALSQGASLIINQPPVISTQPASQTVLPGTNVSFVVVASGTGAVTYQWLFNGMPIPGATSATFTTNNVGLGAEGNYAVLVTDSIATVSSQTARLIVKIAPIILIPPVGQTNPVGATATFTVRCSGSVPMTFIWRRGSTPVATNVLYTTNDALTITNLQLIDSNGTYRVVVTNSGSISVNGTNVTFSGAVWPATAILAQPTNRTVNVGDAASFSLIATSLNLTYQWRLNGANLPDATNATLNLANIQPSQAGGYSALVSNIVGTATSQTATLTVLRTLLTEPEYLANGMMRFKLLGNSNQAYYIESSTNLVDWPTLTNLLATNAVMPFLDGTSPGVTNRFYRARLAP